MMEGVKSITRLSWELFSRDIIARYRGSKLGYFWLLVTPLAMASVWIFIRRLGFVNIGDGPTNYVAYITTGVFLWQGFTRQIQSSMTQLAQYRHLFSKYFFPWEALVLAGWAEAIVEFAFSMAILAVILLVMGSLSGWGLLVSLPWMASLLLLGGGIGLLLAPFGLLYEDVGRALNLVLQCMFFLIPIVYLAPTDRQLQLLVEWNPVAVLLMGARDEILLGRTTMLLKGLCASIFGVLFVVLGFATLRVARPHLAVTVN